MPSPDNIQYTRILRACPVKSEDLMAISCKIGPVLLFRPFRAAIFMGIGILSAS
jgi:hypothetical protein